MVRLFAGPLFANQHMRKCKSLSIIHYVPNLTLSIAEKLDQLQQYMIKPPEDLIIEWESYGYDVDITS